MPQKYKTKLAELHSHLGAAVQPHILWSIAHDQGIKLPTKSYWEFEELLTVKPGEFDSFFEINKQLFKLSELIQSSPLALEPAVHGTITGAYRSSNIVIHELRFCPAKRNRGGERDLDYIILSTIRGLEKAMLEYPEIKAGIIVALDREFDSALNRIIYEKAKRYQNRGIIGLDLAGPQMKDFKIDELFDIFQDAKQNGFGITAHTGEEGNLVEMEAIIDKIKPHRIGHGFLAWQDEKIMKKLVDNNIYLEICPTSNFLVGHLNTYSKMKKVYRKLYKAGVKLTINTDDPEFFTTNLPNEINLLIKNKIFSKKEMTGIIQNSFDASFVK